MDARRLLGLIALAAAVAAATVSVGHDRREGSDVAQAASGPPRSDWAPAPLAVPTRTPSVTPSKPTVLAPPSTAPPRTPTPTIVRSEVVALRIPAIRVNARVAPVDSHLNPETGLWDPISPPSDTDEQLKNLAVWWRQRAVPSVPSTGTTYLYGHNCSKVECVFNDLHRLRLRDVVVVETRTGIFTLRVVSTAAMNTTSKDPSSPNATVDSALYRRPETPNRVVLFTCGFSGDKADGISLTNQAVVTMVEKAEPRR